MELATAGVLGYTATTLAVDAATGRTVTTGQLWDAALHGLTYNGALGAVGASSERFFMLKGLPGTTANKFGAEGEILVGQEYGFEPAHGQETVTGTASGYDRATDFFSTDTIPEYNAVFEMKNKSYSSTNAADK